MWKVWNLIGSLTSQYTLPKKKRIHRLLDCCTKYFVIVRKNYDETVNRTCDLLLLKRPSYSLDQMGSYVWFKVMENIIICCRYVILWHIAHATLICSIARGSFELIAFTWKLLLLLTAAAAAGNVCLEHCPVNFNQIIWYCFYKHNSLAGLGVWFPL